MGRGGGNDGAEQVGLSGGVAGSFEGVLGVGSGVFGFGTAFESVSRRRG